MNFRRAQVAFRLSARGFARRSNSETEYEETPAKAAGLFAALNGRSRPVLRNNTAEGGREEALTDFGSGVPVPGFGKEPRYPGSC